MALFKENFEIKKSIPSLYGDIEKGSSLRMTLYEDHIFILSMFDELSSKYSNIKLKCMITNN